MESDFFERKSEPVGRRVGAGLSKIGMVIRNEAWNRAGGRGLTPTQGQILALLRSAGDKAPGLGAIAAHLGVTAATASDSLSSLESKGMVVKSRDSLDSRVLRVKLTERGQEEAERASAWPDFLLGAVGELDEEEQVVFLRALIKMIRGLQEQGRIPVQRMCATCRYFGPNVHPDQARPHHCAYVDAPFGDRHLRLDCADHETAEAGIITARKGGARD